MQCVRETIVDIERITAGNNEVLYKTLKSVKLKENDENYFDSNMLSRMSAANVATDDPELSRLRRMYCSFSPCSFEPSLSIAEHQFC
jgi:rRNA-processing protein FCF1